MADTVIQPFGYSAFSGLAIIFGTYYLLWIVYARTLHPLAKYSGPLLASFSRTWIGWRLWKGDADIAELELHRRYGTFVRIAPDEISISDPAALRHLYGTNSKFTKTDFYHAFRANFGRHPDLFSESDESKHTERRRIVNHLYSMSSVFQSEKYIDGCMEMFMTKLARLSNRDETVDLVRWLQWFTFDVIGELYFSRTFGFMEREEDHGRWIASFEKLLPILAVASVMPTYVRTPLLIGSMMIPGTGGALKELQKICDASETCVTERLELLQKEPKHREDILQKMMNIHQEKGAELDFRMVDIQVEVYVGLVAGSDTTMIGIAAILYHLLKTPSALSKLQKEIDNATRNNQLSEVIKYREASKLLYLGACIKEGLRMHPSAALTYPRYVPKGGATICGEYLPEGYRVGVSAAVLHRDKSCFGEDADTFEPERWFRDGPENMERHFFTFGAGARTCMGKNIALCETYKLVAQILRDYDLRLAHGDHWKWTTLNHWFHKPMSLPVRLTKRPLAPMADPKFPTD